MSDAHVVVKRFDSGTVLLYISHPSLKGDVLSLAFAHGVSVGLVDKYGESLVPLDISYGCTYEDFVRKLLGDEESV